MNKEQRLDQYLLEKSGVKEYECQYCGEDFSDLKELVWHEEWDHRFSYLDIV